MASRFELLYFPAAGRAEVARAILSYAQADWTNKFPEPDWPSIKADQPFLQVPVLTEYEPDGTKFVLAQSAVIERYLAEKFGLTGKTLKDRAYLDSISEHYHEMGSLLGTAVFGSDEKKEKALEELKKYLQGYATTHERLLEKNGSNGHYLGNTTTYVDIMTVLVISLAKKVAPEALNESSLPNVHKVIATVKADDKFAKNYKPFQHLKGCGVGHASVLKPKTMQ